MDLEWRPIVSDLEVPIGLFLVLDELARVSQRVDGCGWVSHVGRHRRDYRRHLHAIAPTRALAIRWAEAWTRAHLTQIRTELPHMVPGAGATRIEYPASNPMAASR